MPIQINALQTNIRLKPKKEEEEEDEGAGEEFSTPAGPGKGGFTLQFAT